MSLLANPRIRLFSGAVMISFSPVFVALVNVSPTTSGFYRVLIGGVALGVFIFLTGRKLSLTRRVWIALILTSLFFAADLWFWHRSIINVGPGLSTLLANMQVFFMIAAGVFLLGQRVSRVQVFAAVLAIVGLTLIVGPDWNGIAPGYRAGVIFGILTAISYAGYMLCMRAARLRSSYAVPMREVAVVSLLTAMLLGAAAFVEGESLAIPTLADAGWLLGYGLLAHAIGQMLIASSLANVTTTETGIALLVQPSLSFIWDILFFGRTVSVIEGVGAAIALIAIFVGTSTMAIRRPA